MLKPKICSIYHWTIKWSLAAQNCQNIFSGRFLVVRSLRDWKITFLKSSHFDSKRKKFQLNQAHPWGIKKSFFCRSRFFPFFAFSTFLYSINVALCLSRLSRDKFYITGIKYTTKIWKIWEAKRFLILGLSFCISSWVLLNVTSDNLIMLVNWIKFIQIDKSKITLLYLKLKAHLHKIIS